MRGSLGELGLTAGQTSTVVAAEPAMILRQRDDLRMVPAHGQDLHQSR